MILTGPHTQIVAPGEIVYFNCHARGDNVYWYINGTDAHHPQSNFVAKGFNFSDFRIPRPSNELEEHNNTITVEARPSNNNTHITCTAAANILHQQASQDGNLIIAGICRFYSKMSSFCMAHNSINLYDQYYYRSSPSAIYKSEH